MGKIRSISIRVSYEIKSLMQSVSKMRKGLLFLLILIFQSGSLFAQNNNRIDGSLYPTSAAVPDKLFLTSEKLSESERFSIQTLMGILAKTKPEILRDVYGHRDIVADLGIPIDDTYYADFSGLLSKFANRLDGYILCDARSSSSNVAVSLSGILNAVAIPANIESKAKAAGLKLLLDVRGKDEKWALANYGDQFSKKIATYQAFDNRWVSIADYSVFTGAFQFWDDNPAGTLATSVYDRMDSGATFFGWGAGEYETVEQLSQRSLMIHPSDWAPNLSTLTNIPVEIKKQKESITPFKVVPKVHTVCFVISDGDNVQWLLGSFNNTGNWNSPNQSRVNLGWTISPAMVELAPVVYNKYIDNMQTTSEGRNVLIAGPSGRGYFLPGIFPDLAKECSLLNKYMKKADLNIVNILDVDNGEHKPDEYLKQSNIDALFYYTYGANYTGMNGKISWYKDKPSIGGRYNLWGDISTPESLALKLNQESTDIYSENGYSLIPVHIWSRGINDVLECIRKLGPNVRVVAPDEFIWLVRKNLKGLPIGNGNGLKGDYYQGSDFNLLKYSKTNGRLDFDWADKTPSATITGEQFSVRWSGQIVPLYSEEYTFNVAAGDGTKLTINGKVLFDALAETGTNSPNGKIILTAGEKYDIELEYSEKADRAFCTLSWESESQVQQVVPQTQLYSPKLATKGIVTVYDSCNSDGFSAGLTIGGYTLSQLSDLGLTDNVISSVELTEGFKAILYDGDNFTGESIEINAGVRCLGNVFFADNHTSWDNRVSSVQIVANGATNMSGVYYLKNRKSNLNLDVVGGVGGKSDGINIQQWNPNSNANQQFKFTHLGNGVYSVEAMHSMKSLDVVNASRADGANVQQWTNYKSANQQFILVAAGNDYYKLIAKHSGKLVHVANQDTQPEANVQQWTNNNQTSGQWKMIPAAISIGTGDGLTGRYYNGMNFENYKFVRVDSNIDFNWGEGSPAVSISNNAYSIRWTGQIQPLYNGMHTFYINSDNGRRLWIDNKLIIDKWIGDWGVEYSGNISLTAGQKYDIKLEYFEDAGGANCKLEWSGEQAKEIVPQSQLYSEVYTGMQTLNPNCLIYPNPVQKVLFINGLSEAVQLEVYNSYGLKIKENTGVSVDVEAIPAGLYFLTMKTAVGPQTSKFIKQ